MLNLQLFEYRKARLIKNVVAQRRVDGDYQSKRKILFDNKFTLSFTTDSSRWEHHSSSRMRIKSIRWLREWIFRHWNWSWSELSFVSNRSHWRILDWIVDFLKRRGDQWPSNAACLLTYHNAYILSLWMQCRCWRHALKCHKPLFGCARPFRSAVCQFHAERPLSDSENDIDIFAVSPATGLVNDSRQWMQFALLEWAWRPVLRRGQALSRGHLTIADRINYIHHCRQHVMISISLPRVFFFSKRTAANVGEKSLEWFFAFFSSTFFHFSKIINAEHDYSSASFSDFLIVLVVVGSALGGKSIVSEWSIWALTVRLFHATTHSSRAGKLFWQQPLSPSTFIHFIFHQTYRSHSYSCATALFRSGVPSFIVFVISYSPFGSDSLRFFFSSIRPFYIVCIVCICTHFVVCLLKNEKNNQQPLCGWCVAVAMKYVLLCSTPPPPLHSGGNEQSIIKLPLIWVVVVVFIVFIVIVELNTGISFHILWVIPKKFQICWVRFGRTTMKTTTTTPSTIATKMNVHSEIFCANRKMHPSELIILQDLCTARQIELC